MCLILPVIVTGAVFVKLLLTVRALKLTSIIPILLLFLGRSVWRSILPAGIGLLNRTVLFTGSVTLRITILLLLGRFR